MFKHIFRNQYFWVSLTMFILVVIMTFPLIFNFATNIQGFFSTDETYGVLWDSWRIKHSFLNSLSLKSTDLMAYPFGINIYSSPYFASGWLFLHHLLSITTNPILSYNIQSVFNLFTSAFFVYLLVFYLSQSYSSGVFSAIIFAFCPYQFVRIWQHLGLSYSQLIPLVLFASIILKEKESIRASFLFLFCLLLILSFDLSIAYMSMVTIVAFFVFIIVDYFAKRREKKEASLLFKYFKKVLILFFISLIIVFPQFINVFKNIILKAGMDRAASAFNIYHRPFNDLFSQSARPLSYFLPAVVHPIFGRFSEQFIGSPLYGVSFTEHTLYLGWTPLILAFIAFRRGKKEKDSRVASHKSKVNESFYLGFFVFLAIAAWLFSQPPWWNIFGFKLYMPSFFMYKILPMYRAYCRFGIVVMLAIAVLAGFGLKSILERFKSKRVKLALTCLFSGLVLFEFWNWPPYKVIDVSKVPAVYYWLKEQSEDFAIVEYPLDADSPNEMYKFYQTAHEKKIINGTIPGTYANKVAQSITKLSDLKTTRLLKWMGVRYALVHREAYLKTELIEEIEELNKIHQNPGLKFIKGFPSQDCPKKNIICVQETGPIDVYEVISSPIEPEVKK